MIKFKPTLIISDIYDILKWPIKTEVEKEKSDMGYKLLAIRSDGSFYYQRINDGTVFWQPDLETSSPVKSNLSDVACDAIDKGCQDYRKSEQIFKSPEAVLAGVKDIIAKSAEKKRIDRMADAPSENHD